MTTGCMALCENVRVIIQNVDTCIHVHVPFLLLTDVT